MAYPYRTSEYSPERCNCGDPDCDACYPGNKYPNSYEPPDTTETDSYVDDAPTYEDEQALREDAYREDIDDGDPGSLCNAACGYCGRCGGC